MHMVLYSQHGSPWKCRFSIFIIVSQSDSSNFLVHIIKLVSVLVAPTPRSSNPFCGGRREIFWNCILQYSFLFNVHSFISFGYTHLLLISLAKWFDIHPNSNVFSTLREHITCRGSKLTSSLRKQKHLRLNFKEI